MNRTAQTPLAIFYDFDGTLAPGNMQNRRFVPDIGMNADDFWKDVETFTIKTQSDPTISYMYTMLRKAKEAGIAVTREDMAKWGENMEMFPGVETWFGRINRAAAGKGIKVSHYVLSSGNAEIIEACPIAAYFDAIFASRFIYDEEGRAVWPAVALNFTTKTQYLFRVNKGAFGTDFLDTINRYIPDEDRPVPFENIIYIGDGETDVPCFRTVKSLGGMAVAVHDKGQRQNAERFLKEGRVNAVAPADYREGRKLEKLAESWMTLASSRRTLHDIQTGKDNE